MRDWWQQVGVRSLYKERAVFLQVCIFLPFWNAGLGASFLFGNMVPVLVASFILLILNGLVFVSFKKYAIRGSFATIISIFFILVLMATFKSFAWSEVNTSPATSFTSLAILVSTFVALAALMLIRFQFVVNAEKVLVYFIFVNFLYHFVVYAAFSGINILDWYLPSSRFIVSSLNITLGAGLLAACAIHYRRYLLALALIGFIVILSKRSVSLALMVLFFHWILSLRFLKFVLVTGVVLSIPLLGAIPLLEENLFSESLIVGAGDLSRTSYRSALVGAWWGEFAEGMSFFGNGFDASSYVVRSKYGFPDYVTSFHNTYLDLIYCFGFPAFLLFLVVFCMAILRSESRLFVLVLGFLSVVMLTESLLVTTNSTVIIVCMILLLNTRRRQRRALAV